ncbi:uncharacterized protein LOC129218544 isoform X2 [Uloborus diversus]|uniref:uncharacterized protein LOC129218544 isoform X2 n=1 Tax=Uloborus diversus TaxID=327109 RepID=UPI00240A100A|nr:uncharacterized protein LOC129218544 isoform X2 [Uloborus diversus]
MDKFFFSKLFGDFRTETGHSENHRTNAMNDNDGSSPGEPEQDPFDRLFSGSFHNFDAEVSDMFHDMETMFRNVFSSSFESIGFHNWNERFHPDDDPRNYMFKSTEENSTKIMPPIFGAPFNDDSCKDSGLEYWSERFPTEENPINYMLKNPEESQHPTKIMPKVFDGPLDDSYKDTDIDDRVAANGLFSKRNLPPLKWEQPASSAYKFKKIVSIKTVQTPNGVIKEQQTFSDSNGKKVTKITRSIGDQTHEIINHSDKNGLKEKEENFFNLDENTLSDFEKRWQNLKIESQKLPFTNSEREKDELQSVTEKPLAPTGDSKYLSLFKKYFGRSI